MSEPLPVLGTRKGNILFYEERLRYYEENFGGITNFNTLVTPTLILAVKRRLLMLKWEEKYNDIKRRLLS